MRPLIEQHLSARGEATAKQMTAALGLEVKDVLRELNAMLGEALVEREKRGGNEYVYWLTSPSKPVEKAEVTKAGQTHFEDDAALEKILRLETENGNLRADRDAFKTLSDDQRQQIERLRNELASVLIDRDALREQLDGIPTVEANTAGYLVKAPKRKPAIVMDPGKARARAMSAARNGSGRGEVFALVFVGRAVRGAEWQAS